MAYQADSKTPSKNLHFLNQAKNSPKVASKLFFFLNILF